MYQSCLYALCTIARSPTSYAQPPSRTICSRPVGAHERCAGVEAYRGAGAGHQGVGIEAGVRKSVLHYLQHAAWMLGTAQLQRRSLPLSPGSQTALQAAPACTACCAPASWRSPTPAPKSLRSRQGGARRGGSRQVRHVIPSTVRVGPPCWPPPCQLPPVRAHQRRSGGRWRPVASPP